VNKALKHFRGHFRRTGKITYQVEITQKKKKKLPGLLGYSATQLLLHSCCGSSQNHGRLTLLYTPIAQRIPQDVGEKGGGGEGMVGKRRKREEMVVKRRKREEREDGGEGVVGKRRKREEREDGGEGMVGKRGDRGRKGRKGRRDGR
jgi:hypothetical protein